MEPRARAAKNLGKMTFNNTERMSFSSSSSSSSSATYAKTQPWLTRAVTQLLYAHGDVQNPLPETIRVLDEIATDFIQSLAFDATRAANYAGRQKVKFEDFEFVFRKNPMFLGKVQEVIEKKSEIDSARKIIDDSEHAIMKNAGNDEKDKDGAVKKNGAAATAATAAATAASAAAHSAEKSNAPEDDEELGEADDDDTEDVLRKK